MAGGSISDAADWIMMPNAPVFFLYTGFRTVVGELAVDQLRYEDSCCR